MKPTQGKHESESIAVKLRIIWAIAAKDLLEALKNKNTIAVILTSLFVVFAYRGIPILTSSGEKTVALIHDAGNSTLFALLENNQNYRFYAFPSEEAMKAEMGDAEAPELAISIPEGFDQALERGEAPQLRGFAIHWLSQADVDALKRGLEAEISRLLGREITIQMQAERVFNHTESGGLGMWATLSLVFLIIMIGMTLIPHLMMEEKQTHTLEALLVSPASAGKVITAKAIVGIFYGLLGAAVTIALYHQLVVHWWVLILAAALLALFTAAIGLLLGVIVENRGQLTLWAWVFLVPFMLPIFFVRLEGLLPEALIEVCRYIPTVVAFELVQSSYAGSIPITNILLQMAWLAGWAGVVLLGVAMLVNRRDRQGTFVPAVWQAQLDTAAAGGAGLFAPLVTNLPWVRKEAEADVLPDRDTDKWDLQSDTVGDQRGLRIIGAIAGKDVMDAVQNKLVIAILLGSLVMVATSAVLPLLLRLQDKPAAVAYDEGRSTILRGLTGQEDFILSLSETEQELEQYVIELPMSPIGLVIPPNFDQQAGREEVIELEARVAHWTDLGRAARWVDFFEQQLSQASWSKVEIKLAEDALYPTSETGGQPMITAMLLAVGLLTIGIAMVPLLMVEEKEARTFDALLVSPASFIQIVGGKALAGAFYVLLLALVIILLNVQIFVHWEVVILATVFGIALVVAIGMLVGVAADSPTSAGLWGSLLLLSLITPVVIERLVDIDSWSPVIQAVLRFSPGTIILSLYNFSMLGELPVSLVLSNLFALLIWVGLVYLLVWQLIRRADR